jgi:hypothetical protein
VLAIALGISIGAVYLTNKYPLPIDQADANNSVAGSSGIAELPNPAAAFARSPVAFQYEVISATSKARWLALTPGAYGTNDRTRPFRLSTMDAGRR